MSVLPVAVAFGLLAVDQPGLLLPRNRAAEEGGIVFVAVSLRETSNWFNKLAN